jgi:hypothetical protein
MLRSLVFSLFALLLAGQARAFSPEGATAQITDLGSQHGFAIGLTGLDSTLAENPSGDRLTMTRMAMVGLTWSRAGFYVGVSAGHMDYAQYVLPSYTVGTARLRGCESFTDLRRRSGVVLPGLIRW